MYSQQPNFFNPTSPLPVDAAPCFPSSSSPVPRQASPELSLTPAGERPYPPVQRRSFRDVSSSGDYFNGGAWGHDGASIASAGMARKGSTPGVIGEGRKASYSSNSAGPSPVKASDNGAGDGVTEGAPWSHSPVQHSSLSLGGLDGIFDGRTALGLAQAFAQPPASSTDSERDALGSQPVTTPVKSRPSSFILDILPTQTDQARERAAGQAGAATLSVDTSQGMARSVASSSRASSPAPSPAGASTAESATLEARVSVVEQAVAELSTVVQSQMRSLRGEVAQLREIVVQMQQSGGGQSSSAAISQQDTVESPMLTLRSPSPPHQQSVPGRGTTSRPTSAVFPSSPSLLQQQQQQQRVVSPSFWSPQPTSVYQPAQQQQHQPQMAIPPSPALSTTPAANANDGNAVASADRDKDEQIRLLTAQVSALTSSVSSLMQSTQGIGLGRPPLSGGGGVGMGRQASLPGSAMGLGMSVPAGGAAQQQQKGGRAIGGSSAMTRGGGSTSSMGVSMSRQASWNGVMTTNGDGQSPAGGNAGSPAAGAAGSLGGKWESLGVSAELFRAVAKYGLGPPTKVQIKAIPCVLRSQDIIAQAASIQERIQAYVIPALQVLLSASIVSAASGNHEGSSPSMTSIAQQQAQLKGIQVIIITATVDQAAQAQRLSLGLGTSLGFRTSLCVGAVSSHNLSELTTEAQTLAQQPPHVLVGTPQKMLELFKLGIVSPNDVRLLVIDECDQLIARNLAEHVAALVKLLPPSAPSPAVTASNSSPASLSSSLNVSTSPVIARSPLLGQGSAFDAPPTPSLTANGSVANHPGRQTAIYSCTVPQDVLNFASSLQLREQVRVLVRREGAGAGGAGDSTASSTTPNLRNMKHFYLYIAVGAGNESKAVGSGRREASSAREWKLEALADLCEDYPFDKAIVFCSSVESVEAVSYKLGTRAVECYALHQDMGQSSRNAVINKFRTKAASVKKVLVVCDALCRSMGEVSVSLVVNYDLPRQTEDYVHRVAFAAVSPGFGRPGVVINVVTPGPDVDMLRSIEGAYRCKIAELPPNFG